MRDHPLRSLAILTDEEAPRRKRVGAATELARWAHLDHPEIPLVKGVLEKAIAYWRSLSNSQEEVSARLLHDRARVARACATLSLALPGTHTFARNIPRNRDVEGPHPHKDGSLIRGPFDYMYGSIYEFHWEYPIDGFGVQKDLIVIVEPNGERTPLFEWLRSQRAIIWCSRCGLEITYEVSRDCPARELRGPSVGPRLL